MSTTTRMEHARHLHHLGWSRVGDSRFRLQSPEGRIRVELREKGSVLLWRRRTTLQWRKLSPPELHAALVLLVEERTRVQREPLSFATPGLEKPVAERTRGTATLHQPATTPIDPKIPVPVDPGRYYNPSPRHDPEADRALCKAHRHARRTWRKLRHEARRT